MGRLLLFLVNSTLTVGSLAAADLALDGNVRWLASLNVGPLVVRANCTPITSGSVAETAVSEVFHQIGSANGAEMVLAVRLVMAVTSLPALLVLFTPQRLRISLPSQPTESNGAAAVVDRQPEQPRAA